MKVWGCYRSVLNDLNVFALSLEGGSIAILEERVMGALMEEGKAKRGEWKGILRIFLCFLLKECFRV